MIGIETAEVLVQFLEWYRSQDQDRVELMHTDELVAEFLDEVNP